MATGRGGVPLPEEWPFVIGILLAIAFLGTSILITVGLTRLEAILVAALAPLLVLVDAPLGNLTPRMGLAANFAGCIIPAAVAIKVLIERRAPLAEATFLVGVGIVVSYFASHVEPDRGVLLQYRLPAVVLGMLAAGLLYRRAEAAGAIGFSAGALGVVIGADVLHLGELAAGAGGGRIVLGGAGLMDGIILVAVLSAALAQLLSVMLRTVVRMTAPSKPTV